MQQVTLDEIEAAASIVYAEMQATPQYCWPLLCGSLGTEVWVKHENHSQNGAFKIRGGLVYFAHLANASAIPTGVVCATRGNIGQSVGFSARRYGIPATIVVPQANGVEKMQPCVRFEWNCWSMVMISRIRVNLQKKWPTNNLCK